MFVYTDDTLEGEGRGRGRGGEGRDKEVLHMNTYIVQESITYWKVKKRLVSKVLEEHSSLRGRQR